MPSMNGQRPEGWDALCGRVINAALDWAWMWEFDAGSITEEDAEPHFSLEDVTTELIEAVAAYDVAGGGYWDQAPDPPYKPAGERA